MKKIQVIIGILIDTTMQNIKFLTNGFFEHPQKKTQSFQLSPYSVRKNFDKVLLYFELKSCYDNKLKFNCGYFSPLNEITNFHLMEEETTSYTGFKIINIDPSFFVFLLPYPLIYFQAKRNLKTFSENLNPFPFKNKEIFNLEKKHRFSSEILNNDLSNNFLPSILIEEMQGVMNFMGNNCYPLFVENIQDIRIIADDYFDFLKEILGLELGISSLSKIIIPFFDIDKFNSVSGDYIYDDGLPF